MSEQHRQAHYARVRKRHDKWREDPLTMPWDRLRLRAIVTDHHNVHVRAYEVEELFVEDDKDYPLWFLAHCWSAKANNWMPFYVDLVPRLTNSKRVALVNRKKRWAQKTGSALHLTKIDDYTEGRLRTFLMRLRRAQDE